MCRRRAVVWTIDTGSIKTGIIAVTAIHTLLARHSHLLVAIGHADSLANLE